MKPKVFIASSTAGIPVAEAIQIALSYDAEPSVWNQGQFRTTNVPLENLMRLLDQFDFAVFVFLPEDTVYMRDEQVMAVRDNVLFELGLFIAKLGRERNFLLAPKEDYTKLHLPSDLAGITPAFYDGAAKNRDAAVVIPLHEFKKTIRELGARDKKSPTETILYDGTPNNFREFHFSGWNGCFWKNDEQASPRSDGELHVLPEGVLKVDRRTVEGRYEISLRHHGKNKPSVPKKYDISDRVLRLTCDVKVDGANHKLHFILKDERTDKWAADEIKNVSAIAWTPIKLYFRVPPTADLLLRIDDEVPSSAPTSLYLRNLILAEEVS